RSSPSASRRSGRTSPTSASPRRPTCRSSSRPAPSAPWACSTATGAASPRRPATSSSPWAAASPRACSAPCSRSRRWTWRRGSSITSPAALPPLVQARPFDAMGLLYSDRRGFSPEDRNILVALRSSIAQSLQRAMFYEQEMDLAQGLQQAMLPRTIASVRGADVAVRYRAASIGGTFGRDIGGDWYDLIPLPGGRVG